MFNFFIYTWSLATWRYPIKLACTRLCRPGKRPYYYLPDCSETLTECPKFQSLNHVDQRSKVVKTSCSIRRRYGTNWPSTSWRSNSMNRLYASFLLIYLSTYYLFIYLFERGIYTSFQGHCGACVLHTLIATIRKTHKSAQAPWGKEVWVEQYNNNNNNWFIYTPPQVQRHT